MARSVSDSINVFEPDKDLLDRAVEGYEQNVPLSGQILAGFTPPGVAIDIAEMTKYGRDAAREFGQGNIGRGFANAGIAGLSALGTIPLVGDLIKPGGKSFIKRTFLKTTTPSAAPGAPLKSDELRRKGGAFEKRTEKRFALHQLGPETTEDFFGRSLRLNPEFQDVVSKQADQFGLEVAVDARKGAKIDYETGQPLGQVKKTPRINEKVVDKYKGDHSQIMDPIRNKIFVETPAQADEIAKQISDKFPTIDSGMQIYKDFNLIDRKLNIAFTAKNGEKIITELVLQPKAMHLVSEKNHHLYEAFRSKHKGLQPGAADSNIVKEGKRLKDIMFKDFTRAQDEIDPAFLIDLVEKYNSGGQVISGSLGKLSSIAPNIFTNSASVKLVPSTKKSAICEGVAITQSDSSAGIKNPNTLSSTGGVMTAGPFSQEKYSITPILHKSANNNNEIYIELDEAEV